MKTDMENLKASMAKTLTFFRRIDQLSICEKKAEGSYNPSKSVKVHVLNSLHVSRLFWTYLLSFQFDLQKTFQFKAFLFQSKLCGQEVQACKPRSFTVGWGGVGVSLFSLNLLHFVLINTSVAVNFVHIKPFSKQFWELCS